MSAGHLSPSFSATLRVHVPDSPGVFRGALDVRASAITRGMELAASTAIAGAIPPDELGPEYVVPSVFNRDVAPLVAAAVAEAAERDGVARKSRS
jgi:malate dehydrogenase (oxaloacetate-decarboxylating)